LENEKRVTSELIAAAEKLTTPELITAAYKTEDSEQYWHFIAQLHKRGTSLEFNEAKRLIDSEDSVSREMGADILGQLGCSKQNFQEESVSILITLLNDTNEDVIASAAFSLGHRNDARAISPLIRLIDHPNPRVRFGVTFGLGCLNETAATDALIKLSHDADYDVRNWATFELASLCEADSDEIRQALFERLSDQDYEIRGEAFVGLARRKEYKIGPLLQQELAGEFNGNWAVEAAKLLEDSNYYPILCELRQRLEGEVEERFIEDIDSAIVACSQKLT